MLILASSGLSTFLINGPRYGSVAIPSMLFSLKYLLKQAEFPEIIFFSGFAPIDFKFIIASFTLSLLISTPLKSIFWIYASCRIFFLCTEKNKVALAFYKFFLYYICGRNQNAGVYFLPF